MICVTSRISIIETLYYTSVSPLQKSPCVPNSAVMGKESISQLELLNRLVSLENHQGLQRTLYERKKAKLSLYATIRIWGCWLLQPRLAIPNTLALVFSALNKCCYWDLYNNIALWGC